MNDFNLNVSRVLPTLERQVKTANYRARNVGLADTFTIDQWLTILNYWKWRCAVCDVQSQDLSPDHWLPLSHEACSGSTYDNIVPLCEGCNLSKNRTEPSAWLANRFGDTVAAEKMARVRTAFGILTVPGHPFNTTIPEKTWIVEQKKIEDRYKKLTIVFDMNDKYETEIWKWYIDTSGLSEQQLSIVVKNFLFMNSVHVTDPVYHWNQDDNH